MDLEQLIHKGWAGYLRRNNISETKWRNLCDKRSEKGLLWVQGSQGALSKEEELFYRQSQGRAHLFMDMRIVNEQDQELPWDGKAAGELQVRGPHVLKAYFRVGCTSLGMMGQVPM